MGPKVGNALLWVFDPFEDDAGYFRRRMFGLDAAYLDGVLYLVVGSGDEPWNGVLVCTSWERHAALVQDIPELTAHPVLGKWLYLSQNDEAFEAVAARLVGLARGRDPRLGVEPRGAGKPGAKAGAKPASVKQTAKQAAKPRASRRKTQRRG